MSFIYPRTLAIARPAGTGSAAGVQPFQEFTPAQMTAIASGIPCSIQGEREAGRPLGDVPGDTRARGTWKILISAGNAAAAGINVAGAVLERDVCTDDAGGRYQVGQAWWDSMGWALRCERLEA